MLHNGSPYTRHPKEHSQASKTVWKRVLACVYSKAYNLYVSQCIMLHRHWLFSVLLSDVRFFERFVWPPDTSRCDVISQPHLHFTQPSCWDSENPGFYEPNSMADIIMDSLYQGKDRYTIMEWKIRKLNSLPKSTLSSLIPCPWS